MQVHGLVEQLNRDGCCVLPSIFNDERIEEFRKTTLDNLGSMGQTRDVAHSYHLAGFHRFPALSFLHSEIAANSSINEFLSEYYGSAPYFAIGLSDVTVNRSQHWHTDLLRGEYSTFLDAIDPWSMRGDGCIKALVYLQTGRSLRIARGSHLVPTPLDDKLLDDLAGTREVTQLEVNAGDVVMMDIRSLHRGSTDDEMRKPELADSPKILISTVFGPVKSAFAEAMQLGNAHRMARWDRQHLSGKSASQGA